MRSITRLLAIAALVAGPVLAAAPPLPTRTAPIASGTLHYEVMGGGKGTPLVLLNGGPGASHTYMRDTDAWDVVARDRPVVFYDQRGTGQTVSTTPAAGFTVAMMVADLEALRVALGAEKIDVLGHSWGGVLAMAYATRHPDRVERLILVGSGSPKLATHEYLFDKLYPELLARQAPDTSPAGKMGCVTAWLPDYEKMSYYDQRNRVPGSDDPAQFSQATCTAVMLDAIKLDMFPALRTLRMPALVINGRFDANVAPTVAFAIAKAIPGAQLVYFEHSGHTPFVEEPDRFALVVSRFLADGARRGD